MKKFNEAEWHLFTNAYFRSYHMDRNIIKVTSTYSRYIWEIEKKADCFLLYKISGRTVPPPEKHGSAIECLDSIRRQEGYSAT